MSGVELAEKTCSRCGETKPLTGFYRNANRGDGHHPWCRVCHKAAVDASNTRRRAEDPEGYLLARRQSVERHRERTGNARGKAFNRARSRAVSALIEAHREEYEQRLHLAKYEAGLL